MPTTRHHHHWRRAPGPLLLDLFGARVRELAGQRGRRFEHPDQDWSPTVFLLGRADLSEIPLDAFGFPDSDDLLAAGGLVAALIRQHGAICAGLLFSVWLEARAPGNHPLPGRPLGERELLVLLLAGPMCEQISAAAVYRDGEQPPALQPWTYLDRIGRHAIDPLLQLLWTSPARSTILYSSSTSETYEGSVTGAEHNLREVCVERRGHRPRLFLARRFYVVGWNSPTPRWNCARFGHRDRFAGKRRFAAISELKMSRAWRPLSGDVRG